MKALFFLSILLLAMSFQPAQAEQARLGTVSSELSLAWADPAPAAGGDVMSGEKSPAAACILSIVVPGLGQHYNGQHLKGAVQEVLFVAGATMVLVSVASGLSDWSGEGWEPAVGTTGLIITGGSYLWSVIDAPISASRINARTR
jgi:TM2 domain-containing membrane protein YozV